MTGRTLVELRLWLPVLMQQLQQDQCVGAVRQGHHTFGKCQMHCSRNIQLADLQVLGKERLAPRFHVTLAVVYGKGDSMCPTYCSCAGSGEERVQKLATDFADVWDNCPAGGLDLQVARIETNDRKAQMWLWLKFLNNDVEERLRAIDAMYGCFTTYRGVAHAIEPGKKEFHVELPYSLGAKICVGDAIRPTSLRTKQVGNGGLRQQHRPSWHRPNRFG